MKRPGVIRAKGCSTFDDEQREPWILEENAEGDQTVGETSADKNQLGLHEGLSDPSTVLWPGNTAARSNTAMGCLDMSTA